MKLLVLGEPERVEKYKPDLDIVKRTEVTVVPIDAAEEEVIYAGSDADMAVVDAITPFTENEMAHMPKLRLIHSEGVGYNGIDLRAARARGIHVCNQRGANAIAVAEHTVLLMLALQRQLVRGYGEVLKGNQIETKSDMMMQGIHELSELQVGLVGFGAIGQETARLLVPFGPNVVYCQHHRVPEETEAALHAEFVDPASLLRTSDIVSIHVPASPSNLGMCGRAFFGDMKDQSSFINTSRGELVDNDALIAALSSGKLSGAALDTVAPEPVPPDHPLLHLPPELQRRLIITPHIAGITGGFFRRAHRTIWENAARLERGDPLLNEI